MRRQWFAGLMLVTLGCAGAVDQQGPTEQASKLAAAKARNNGTATSDACAEHAWYGDGVCDTFCAHADQDCVPKDSGAAVVCAEFIEASDSVCSRPDSDACRFQDPDCSSGTRPGNGGGSDPSDPVACALISELPNGVCSRPASDPCRFQDPDCNVADPGAGAPDCETGKVTCQTFAAVVCPDGQVPTVVNGCYGPCVAKEKCATTPSGSGSGSGSSGSGSGAGGSTGSGGSVDCDVRKVTCQTFAEVTCPDGQVPSVVNACYGACVNKADCAPIACTTIIEVADGTCSRAKYDPCRGQDPDCKPDEVVCAQYIEQPDGMCSRAPDDPCIFQDPDCVKK